MLELRSSDTKVYKFTRIRKVNGEPLMLETSFYPQYIYPNLTPELLTTHSFYSLLYDVGVIPYTAVDSYEAVKFSKSDAELLHCRAGSAGFFVQRQTRTESGECYEFTRPICGVIVPRWTSCSIKTASPSPAVWTKPIPADFDFHAPGSPGAFSWQFVLKFFLV